MAMSIRLLLVALLLSGLTVGSAAQSAPAGAKPALFAVLFRTGPKWDAAKPPNDQAFFREHSANLARLRQSGLIQMGARYSDVGLIVVSAQAEAAVRAEIDRDPAVANGTFVYELSPFNVFYDGCLR